MTPNSKPLAKLYWLLLSTVILCLAPATAWADVAPAPDDDDDVVGLCLKGQEPGDECKMPDGDEGTCTDDKQACGVSANSTQYCYVCEDSCNVAAVGSRSGNRGAPVAIGLLAVLGLWRQRRR